MKRDVNAERALAEQLELKQRALDIVLAIDQVRDSVSEPSVMLSALANVLADQLQADLGLICLTNRETGHLELKAVNDRGQLFGQFGVDVAQQLARRAGEAAGVQIWRAGGVLPALQDSDLLGALQLAALPIVMGTNERLGAILLARSRVDFTAADVELLRTAESLIDSAVIQGYTYHDMRQRQKELETIFHIDRIRDRHLPFDEMLTAVVQELHSVIQAEMGFVMLYNQSARELELRAASPDDLFQLMSHHHVVRQTADEALRRGELVCHNGLEGGVTSILCLPLILEEEIIGVVGVVNSYGPDGFSGDDRRLLSAIGSQMDTAIFESLEQRRLRQVLGRSVGPRVMERLLANPDVSFLRGERSVLTVLYADLRGSTRLAEDTDPELLVDFINGYLAAMSEIILAREGTLDKFVGDEVMALFGAPFPQDDHALCAVRVGLEMQAVHQELMASWKARGLAAPPMGVGIATGEMTVGEFGYTKRTDYTVIGRAANLGARLCTAARGGQVLISEDTYHLVHERVAATPIAGLHLKGIERDLTAYLVAQLLD